jgi:threonine/homoserine/homoserine lactone efflux protein
MYIIGGRGGVLSTLLGLFILLIVGCAYVLYYALIAACAVCYFSFLGIRALYRHHKVRKETVSQPQGPNPVMSKVTGKE